MIRLIDLPGIRDLETKEVGRGKFRSEHDRDHFRDQCALTGKELFGITILDIAFEEPEGADLSDEEYDRQYEAWESQFVTWAMSDADAVTHLKSLGWDLTDDAGKPLLILRHFNAVVEAVALGVCGKAPDPAAMSADKWATSLEADAAKFRGGRKF